MRFRTLLFPLLAAVALAGFAAWWLLLRTATVAVTGVEPGALPLQVHGPGSLQARTATTIAARISGRIDQLPVDQGQTVDAGSVMATLDSEEIRNQQRSAAAGLNAALHQEAAARAAVSHAKAANRLAQQELARTRSLYAKALISKAELDKGVSSDDTARSALDLAEATLKVRQAETARLRAESDVLATQLGYTRITAPFHGLVVRRYAEPGQTVSPGTPLFRLIDPATLWVVMRVDEAQSAAIRVGLPAKVKLRTGAEVAGHVARIGLQSDPSTRELEVEVGLDSTPRRYAIGEEAQAIIRTGQVAGMMFPASALLRSGTQPGVLRVERGRALFTPVKLGPVANGEAIALSGLETGMQLIARPGGIKPGARVRPATRAAE